MSPSPSATGVREGDQPCGQRRCQPQGAEIDHPLRLQRAQPTTAMTSRRGEPRRGRLDLRRSPLGLGALPEPGATQADSGEQEESGDRGERGDVETGERQAADGSGSQSLEPEPVPEAHCPHSSRAAARTQRCWPTVCPACRRRSALRDLLQGVVVLIRARIDGLRARERRQRGEALRPSRRSPSRRLPARKLACLLEIVITFPSL